MDLGGINSSIHRVAYDNLTAYLGMPVSGHVILDKVQQIVSPSEQVLQRLDIDTRWIDPRLPMGSPVREFPDGSYLDSWGIRRIPVGYYFEMPSDGHPLRTATIDDLDKYVWPSTSLHETERQRMEKTAQYLENETDYSICTFGGSVFETSWYLRSLEKFLVDLLRNTEFACRLMDKVTDVNIDFFDELLDAIGRYLDVVMIGDDLALQSGPMISLDTYRRYVKPRQQRLIEAIRRKSQAKILYHSCGAASYFFGDLISIGVEAVTPVQVSANGMDTAELKKKWGKQLTFWGAIDTQHVLPSGTPGDVRREVEKRIKDLAPGGGYVLSGVHNIQPDVPSQNIVAMYEHARNYRPRNHLNTSAGSLA
ncbi:MAG: uroporphyrinogen decarboxylase family protein [Candidatus Bathyarchaeia archaeon]|jgi:uroporphyrinogen decarboxylase